MTNGELLWILSGLSVWAIFIAITIYNKGSLEKAPEVFVIAVVLGPIMLGFLLEFIRIALSKERPWEKDKL